MMSKEKIISTYIKAWNSLQQQERAQLLEVSFSKKGRYVDPHIPERVKNIGQMQEVIAIFRSRLPHQLIPLSDPAFHNHVFRLHWKIDDKGSILSSGLFVGEFDEENRIENLICFID